MILFEEMLRVLKMKKINLVIASVLALLFGTLHGSVYLGLSIGVPVIQGSIDSELSVGENIVLEYELYPTYLQPLKRFERHYSVVPNSEVVIIERAVSISSYDLEFTKGEKLIQQHRNKDFLFLRHNVPTEYANIYFFLLQYIVIIFFLFFVYRTIKTYNEKHKLYNA